MSAARKPATSFCITTAISYPNGAPHIGHAYEAITTDAIARFEALDGKAVFFLTGTDEHGLKMKQTATKEGLTPLALADRNAARFQEMAQVLGLSHTDFIRTTEARHYAACQELWKRMETRGDIYQIDDPKADNPNVIEKSTVLRGTGAVGVTYEYPWLSRTANGAHTFSPIAQFIARPDHIEQKSIPNEDAKSLIFTDALLFEVDKASGYDRSETGTRTNLGVQYTYQANGGGYLRAIFGESIHIAGRNPFTLGTGLDQTRSDYVTGLYYEPSTMFRFLAQTRFDQQTLDVARSDLFAYVGYGPIQATVNYAYNRKNPADQATGIPALFVSKEELLGNLQLKLTDHWYLIGSVRYDIEQNRALQDTIGIKYLDECFMLTTTYTETFYTDRDVKPDKQFMVRFELKHLGGFNYHGNPTALTNTVQNISEPQQLNRPIQ